MVDDIIMNEYEKALNFLEAGCGCSCSTKMPKEEFAELREDFQANKIRTRHFLNGPTQIHGWRSDKY